MDTVGLLAVVLVTAASPQDRDGGRLVVARARMKMPSIVLVWADEGYAGRLVEFTRHWAAYPGSCVPPPGSGL